MRILPREEKFFTLFNQQMEVIAEATRTLQAVCKNPSGDTAAASTKLMELEHRGDAILHEIYDKLNETFITPIDPEDIHALGSLLDDVLDYLEDGAHRLDAYKLPEITPEICELLDLISGCVSSLAHAFAALERRDSVLEDCIEINRLEEQADHVERRAVASLFQHQKDPIQLLKYKEIYEILESTTDACEDVADRLQNVVVKNS